MTTTPPIPPIGTEIEFTTDARSGCRGVVERRVGRHGYFVVKLSYAPRASGYRKGDSLHVVATSTCHRTLEHAKAGAA